MEGEAGTSLPSPLANPPSLPSPLANPPLFPLPSCRIQGVEEEDVSQGFVLSSIVKPVPAVTQFEAQLVILDLLEHKSIFTAGECTGFEGRVW